MPISVITTSYRNNINWPKTGCQHSNNYYKVANPLKKIFVLWAFQKLREP